jgi:hypothetical protein
MSSSRINARLPAGPTTAKTISETLRATGEMRNEPVADHCHQQPHHPQEIASRIKEG